MAQDGDDSHNNLRRVAEVEVDLPSEAGDGGGQGGRGAKEVEEGGGDGTHHQVAEGDVAHGRGSTPHFADENLGGEAAGAALVGNHNKNHTDHNNKDRDNYRILAL